MEKRTSGTLGRAAIIWLAAAFLMLPAFAIGHIISDNSFMNVNWSDAFARQLFAGDLYPRWLPDMNSGAGSPVFYFYAPLPFYLTAPFHLVAGPRFAVLLGMWLMLALSGQAFHALAANFVRGSAALLASLAYMAMPYHILMDVWLRSDLGELGAYIFIPLCLLCAFRLASEPIWTFALAASLATLLLSHLPSSLLFAPFLIASCVYAAVQGDFKSVLARASTAAILGLGLAAAYIVPALQLQNLIHPERWGIYRPADNVLFLGGATPFVRILDALAAGAIAIAGAYVSGAIANRRWDRVAPWAAASIVIFIVILPFAAPLWNDLPPVFQKIQFPWRALLMLDLSCCMLFALALELAYWPARLVVPIMLLFLGVTVVFLTTRSRDVRDGFANRTPSVEATFIAERAEPIEYLPTCRPFRSGDLTDGTSALILRRSLNEKPPGEIAVLYYPFLELLNNGRVVSVHCDPKTGFMVVERHVGSVVVRTLRLAPEKVGDWISLTSLGIFFTGLYLSARKRRCCQQSARTAIG